MIQKTINATYNERIISESINKTVNNMAVPCQRFFPKIYTCIHATK